MKLLSVVIPAYNEERIISDSAARVVKVLQEIKKTKFINNYEIIFVDDGSIDETWYLIKNLHNKNSKIVGISLSRNFGLESALMAGLRKSRGDYTVMIDCDLQDPPELIKEMLIKLQITHSDVVYGKRTSRSEASHKQWLFKLFHYIFHMISSNKSPQNVGNFSLMNRRALNALLSFKEKSKYLPGLRYLIGFKQTSISYKRDIRKDGPAKMSSAKLMQLALDALYSFTDLPLKFCFYLGLLGTTISILIGMYALITRLFNYNVTVGWSSTLLSIYFFGSVQLIFLGVIGQYIYKIYIEVQNRPTYFVSEELD